MADMAASVLARLKNKAAVTGRSHQLCMQLFCQEEFLRRLEKTKYAENFVLKGGLFVYAVTDFDSRVTVDVDFLLRKIPNTPEQVKAVLEEIIAVPTENDFVTFEIKSVGPIAVTKKYAGVGASLVAKIKNTRTPFSIDIGVGGSDAEHIFCVLFVSNTYIDITLTFLRGKHSFNHTFSS